MYNNQTSITARTVTVVCSTTVLLLVACSSATLLIDYETGYHSMLAHKAMKLFYVDLELNVPAFFSTVILMAASMLAATIFYLKRLMSETNTRPWAILAGGFAFMAFDEIAALHERLIEPMRSLLGEQALGPFYFAWVVPALVLLVVLGAYFSRFLWDLPRSTKFFFIAGAALFLGGAVGLELFEGRHTEIFGKENIAYMVMTTCEEAMEMFGVIVFIHGLINYIADHYGSINIAFFSSSLLSPETGARPASAGHLKGVKPDEVESYSLGTAGNRAI